MAIETPIIQGGIDAYRAGKNMPGSGSVSAGEAPRSFEDMVANAVSDGIETVKAGDTTARAGLTGEANLQQVVEATMAMESTVKVAVSIRDSLVKSYQEVLRMPV